MVELVVARGGEIRLVDALDGRTHVRERARDDGRLDDLDDQRLGQLRALDEDDVALLDARRVVDDDVGQPAHAGVGHRNRPSR